MLELKANKKLVQQHIASKSAWPCSTTKRHPHINHTQTDKSKEYEAAIQELH